MHKIVVIIVINNKYVKYTISSVQILSQTERSELLEQLLNHTRHLSIFMMGRKTLPRRQRRTSRWVLTLPQQPLMDLQWYANSRACSLYFLAQSAPINISPAILITTTTTRYFDTYSYFSWSIRRRCCFAYESCGK